MPCDLVIGLDLGTTAIKALAVDVAGAVAGEGRAAVELHHPRPGQVVIDPEAYTAAAMQALAQAAGETDATRIAGLAISGAMHSLVPVGADDRPLAAALTWADQRGEAQTHELRRGRDTHALHQRTGCPLRWLYHPPRLRWFREQAPDVDARTARYATLKDLVVHRLTGKWVADLGLMSTTGLIDLARRDFDAEALTLADVGAERLPALCEPTAVVGAVGTNAAEGTGLPRDLPVIAGSSDGPLANLATLRGDQDVAITVGTSAAVRVNCTQPAVDEHELTWCYLIAEQRWVRGGAINNAGLIAQWVADRFFLEVPADRRYGTMLAEAADVAPGAEGLVMLPYLTGERTPIWDPLASGTIHGLTLTHTRAHIARAALEAVAFALAEMADILDIRARLADGVPVSGGIARAPAWCQLLADVLDAPLHVVEVADASAVGAAMVGHRALGHVASLDAAAPSTDAPERVITPGANAGDYEALRGRQVALRRSLHGR